MDIYNILIQVCVIAIPAVLAITLHEAAHGVALNDAEEIRRHLEHRLELVIDGGPCDGTVTTVIDLSGDQPLLLREGKGDVRPFGFVKAACTAMSWASSSEPPSSSMMTAFTPRPS